MTISLDFWAPNLELFKVNDNRFTISNLTSVCPQTPANKMRARFQHIGTAHSGEYQAMADPTQTQAG